MAGDWIKMQKDTPDKPEVLAISSRLGIDPDAVVGKLVRVWSWFDTHTTDGNASCVTYSFLDRLAGVTGFAEQMALVGWLLQNGHLLSLPNFDYHTGETAKKRAMGQKRQEKYRNAPQSNASCVTTASPEKRREENSPSLRSGESAETAPPSIPEKPKTKTLKTYLADCKAAGAKPIPDDHHVRTWAADAGITADMLQIAWVQFRERYTEAEKGKGKRYKDWPGHFANAVKANWFKLWFSGDKGMQWTSVGMTHKNVLDSRLAQRETEHA